MGRVNDGSSATTTYHSLLHETRETSQSATEFPGIIVNLRTKQPSSSLRGEQLQQQQIRVRWMGRQTLLGLKRVEVGENDMGFGVLWYLEAIHGVGVDWVERGWLGIADLWAGVSSASTTSIWQEK